MTDSVQVIWEFLTVAGTGLHALVGTNVWSPEAPATYKNATAAVIYELVDEERNVQPRNTSVVMFRCYGGKRQDGLDWSHGDAREVHRALRERLESADGAQTASGTILMCRHQSSSQSYGDDDTEWPVVEAQYQFEIE